MRIFQLLSTIAYGDAVSNDTVAMEKAIKQMGYQRPAYINKYKCSYNLP